MTLLIALATAAVPLTERYVSLSSVTGGVIAQLCAQEPPTSSGVPLDACNGYILGVADALQLQGITCRAVSDAATLQTVAIARRYIRDHPEEWSAHSVSMIQSALKAAYPCKHKVPVKGR